MVSVAAALVLEVALGFLFSVLLLARVLLVQLVDLLGTLVGEDAIPPALRTSVLEVFDQSLDTQTQVAAFHNGLKPKI